MKRKIGINFCNALNGHIHNPQGRFMWPRGGGGVGGPHKMLDHSKKEAVWLEKKLTKILYFVISIFKIYNGVRQMPRRMGVVRIKYKFSYFFFKYFPSTKSFHIPTLAPRGREKWISLGITQTHPPRQTGPQTI